jgi:hypothetical protein
LPELARALMVSPELGAGCAPQRASPVPPGPWEAPMPEPRAALAPVSTEERYGQWPLGRGHEQSPELEGHPSRQPVPPDETEALVPR